MMGSKVFWAVVFGFLGGVFIRSFIPLGFAFVGFLFLLGIVALAFLFLDRRKQRSYILIAAALFSCAFGIARMQLATLSGDPALTVHLDQNVIIEGVVAQEPDARETSTLLSVEVSSLVEGNATVPIRAGVLATLPAHTKVSYGDEVTLSGKLQLPQAFDTGLGREFDYPDYLGAQGIEYQLGFAQIKNVHGYAGDPVKAFAIDAKELYLRGTDQVLSDPEAALAGGITVGDKRSVGPELSQDFQRDSLVHMIVLSGYNITVVINAVAWMLQRMPRFAQFSGSIFVVIFFILMSGGASSATRAGIMALIAVFARATHRVYLGERVLAAASVAMVLWNPWTLCFDPSFQLSALATLGLILFTPKFTAWFSRVPERFGMREILSSTCATQLMVLPFLLYQNGTFSIVALPANLLALLPVPWAMFFSGIAALGGMIFGPLAAPIAIPAYALLWYIITVAHALASLPFAAISIPAFSVWWMFGTYALLFGGFAFLEKDNGQGNALAANASS
jgi:competence protein ComEC